MMEWIRTFREKQQTSRQTNIQLQAEEEIRITDFNNKLFIAYNGTPMILIEESWTPKDILAKLEETRTGYINYKMKQLELPKAAMFL